MWHKHCWDREREGAGRSWGWKFDTDFGPLFAGMSRGRGHRRGGRMFEQGDLTTLGAPPEQIRRIIEHAVPRPVTPVYTELSELFQVYLHRSLTRQQEPAAALHDAAGAMNQVLARAGLLTR